MERVCPNFTEEEKQKISITHMQKMLSGMLKIARNRSLECVDLTSRQMDILMYLMFCNSENVSQVDIEKQFRMTNPTVTGILNRLEAKGFIVRKSSEQDKRVKHIVATDRVWELHEVINEDRRQLDQIVYKDMTDEELEVLYQCLQKMCRNMAAYLGEKDEDISFFFHDVSQKEEHEKKIK